MLTFVMMPPQNDRQRQWAPRLQRSLPDHRVVVPETEAEARHELLDADTAYGWVPPDMLSAATKLRWLRCGGIGHETARLCTALGMTVLGVDPRPEYSAAVRLAGVTPRRGAATRYRRPGVCIWACAIWEYDLCRPASSLGVLRVSDVQRVDQSQ